MRKIKAAVSSAKKKPKPTKKGRCRVLTNEDVKDAGALDGILDHEFQHDAGDGAADQEGEDSPQVVGL